MKNQLGRWVLFSALVASGCSLEDVDSDAIRTRGMFADMLALAPGDGSTLVRVELTVGGEDGTKVTLVGDDELEARFGEVSAPLQRTGGGRYETQLQGDLAGQVVVELSRGPEDDPAGGSAALPDPFITSLISDASAGIARESEVVVTWAPTVAGGTMAWAVAGSCLWSESGVTADDGTLVLGPESFRVRPSRAGEECEVAVTLERENEGVVDRAWYPFSRFHAIQRRAVSFVSIPAAEEQEAAGAPDPSEE
jgi:hypothetical protein